MNKLAIYCQSTRLGVCSISQKILPERQSYTANLEVAIEFLSDKNGS